jgi:hypothetical protein
MAPPGRACWRHQVLRREYDAKEAKVIEQQRQSQAVLSPQSLAAQASAGAPELGAYASMPDSQRGDRRDLSRSVYFTRIRTHTRAYARTLRPTLGSGTQVTSLGRPRRP